MPTAHAGRRVPRALLAAGAIVLLLGLAFAAGVALNLRDEDPVADRGAAIAASPAQLQRGEYVARIGSCASCHTARGGAAYAGGFAVATPFGTVYSSNLTPDANSGLGGWSASHFWRALHNGRSKDGHLLYPAFPYPNYTRITREDSDALFAWLQQLPPVAQPNREHQLRFPFDTQLALGAWRALFFTPKRSAPEASRSASWNRGAYLVEGLGHCNACHSARNVFGASSSTLDLGGGLIPIQNWYAPSLGATDEAGVQDWPLADVVALLKAGRNAHATVMGPMAEVVFRSTQYLTDADAQAMGEFLRALPRTGSTSAASSRSEPAPPDVLMALGGKIYEQHCKQCHGAAAEGAPGAYPPLAGNRAVTMAVPANLVRIVLNGGYLPSTAGNPRPHGMPPFGYLLSDRDVAAVTTYVRRSFGNRAAAVSELEVLQYH